VTWQSAMRRNLTRRLVQAEAKKNLVDVGSKNMTFILVPNEGV